MSVRAAAEVPAELFRLAAESVDVVGTPYDEVVAEVRSRRRRRTRRIVAATVAAVVVVAGLAVWALVRDQMRRGPSVQPIGNPVEVAWWADGVLHLDRVEVEVPSVTSLVEVGSGAVYADADGVVSTVDSTGAHTEIGRAVPATPLVADPSRGTVAWVGPGGELEAYSVTSGTLLGRTEVHDAARPVAIDQGAVYVVAPDGTGQVWDPVRDVIRPTGRGLLDVAAESRVRQRGDRIAMVQAFYHVTHRVLGQGATLSPGGAYVLTRRPGTPIGTFDPLLYDLRTGARMLDGVRANERVIDATFGDNHSVVFVVEHPADGMVVLRRCEIGGPCVDQAALDPGETRPLLAH